MQIHIKGGCREKAQGKGSHLHAEETGLRETLASCRSEGPNPAGTSWTSRPRICEMMKFSSVKAPNVRYIDMAAWATYTDLFLPLGCTRLSVRLSLGPCWEMLEEGKETSHPFGVICVLVSFPSRPATTLKKLYPSDGYSARGVQGLVARSGKDGGVCLLSLDEPLNWRFGVCCFSWGKGLYVTPSSSRNGNREFSLIPLFFFGG